MILSSFVLSSPSHAVSQSVSQSVSPWFLKVSQTLSRSTLKREFYRSKGMAMRVRGLESESKVHGKVKALRRRPMRPSSREEG